MINKIFSEYLKLNFGNYITIYTDGSVSPLSAGYSFYIPELHISFTNNLPPSSSSFTAECFAIIEALTFISNLISNYYLIASDSLSCLIALNSNPFNSHFSPLVLRIKQITHTLYLSNYSIKFLWVPSHIGIRGNEMADSLAKSTFKLICPSLTLLPHTDLIIFQLYATTSNCSGPHSGLISQPNSLPNINTSFQIFLMKPGSTISIFLDHPSSISIDYVQAISSYLLMLINRT